MLTTLNNMGLKDWTGFIGPTGCIVLEPIDPLKRSSHDKWKIKCHCKRDFISIPNKIKSGHTTSCECSKELNGLVKKEERKSIYVNYINEQTGVKILYPVDFLKCGNHDDWICLCPHHDPPQEFIGTPHHVRSSNKPTLSCGCLQSKSLSEIATRNHKLHRLVRGLREDDFLTDMRKLIDVMLYQPIRPLIFRLDRMCSLCHKNKSVECHHIIPLNMIYYDDITTFKLAYDINNLIPLCEICHWKAHGQNNYDIDLIIQLELQTIVAQRIVPQDIIEEYNHVVETKILPWLNKLRID